MANLSNAFGKIVVEKVGKEFLEFLKTVQDHDGYKLVEPDDYAPYRNVIPDEDGNLSMDFSTSGRWSYASNIEGYLQGTWMTTRAKDSEAYQKLLDALKETGGYIWIEYTDSDPAMDWMGKGIYKIEGQNGEITIFDDWKDQELTITGYAEMTGQSIYDVMDILHSEESAIAYQNYLEECKNTGKEPLDPDYWYDNEYEEE